MNKEIILFKLRSIVRQITCMNPRDLSKEISGNTYKSTFSHYSWQEEDSKKIKYTTTISIEKTLHDNLEE